MSEQQTPQPKQNIVRFPTSKKERPNQELLERQYRRFETGSVSRGLRADFLHTIGQDK